MDSSCLSSIPSKLFSKFVHHVIDNMCSGVLVSHKQFEECPVDKFWLAVQYAKKVIKDLHIGKISKDEITNHLNPLGQKAAEDFLSAIAVREEEINKALVRNSLKDVVHLKDFDWNVRLAVSSDKILDLNESIMTLHLHTSSSSIDQAASTLSVEMSADQIDRLLEQLKGAQEKIIQLSHSKN